jgi:hypothetical protein
MRAAMRMIARSASRYANASGGGIVSGLGDPAGQFGKGTRSPGMGFTGQVSPVSMGFGACARTVFATRF